MKIVPEGHVREVVVTKTALVARVGDRVIKADRCVVVCACPERLCKSPVGVLCVGAWGKYMGGTHYKRRIRANKIRVRELEIARRLAAKMRVQAAREERARASSSKRPRRGRALPSSARAVRG